MINPAFFNLTLLTLVVEFLFHCGSRSGFKLGHVSEPVQDRVKATWWCSLPHCLWHSFLSFALCLSCPPPPDVLGLRIKEQWQYQRPVTTRVNGASHVYTKTHTNVSATWDDGIWRSGNREFTVQYSTCTNTHTDQRNLRKTIWLYKE